MADFHGGAAVRTWTLDICPSSGFDGCCSCAIEGEWTADMEWVEPECPTVEVRVVAVDDLLARLRGEAGRSDIPCRTVGQYAAVVNLLERELAK